MKIASLISCTVFSLSVAIIILIVTVLGIRNLSTPSPPDAWSCSPTSTYARTFPIPGTERITTTLEGPAVIGRDK